nr:MAG TPA: protein of unknown function (DUF1957) [Caudoviricetes sp.]
MKTSNPQQSSSKKERSNSLYLTICQSSKWEFPIDTTSIYLVVSQKYLSARLG